MLENEQKKIIEGRRMSRLGLDFVLCAFFCVVLCTDCVRRVKAALVIEVGRLSPLVISLHSFLLMTSTRPPFSVTSL